MSVQRFLESVPPGRIEQISALGYPEHGTASWVLNTPVVQLHCDACAGPRYFEPPGNEPTYIQPGREVYTLVTYECCNCKASRKTYALRYRLDLETGDAELLKLGEFPPFGSPTPARVISLIGEERDYYLKGRRAEVQDLGIAALAYYRRVVENQKGRIIDEIIRVARKLGASDESVNDLVAARAETGFSRAVEAIKHGIPEALMVNGRNPLILLHSALSEGLHNLTDKECLELATDVRVVLSALAERIGTALKEEAELTSAVNRLLKKQ